MMAQDEIYICLLLAGYILATLYTLERSINK